MISVNYQDVTTLGNVGTTQTELMNAAMAFFVAITVSFKEHPWNLLTTI